MTIAVCLPQVLFATSDDDRRAQALVDECRRGSVTVDLVALPGESRLAADDAVAALRWSLIDLRTGDADVVICLHPIATLVRHETKFAWFNDTPTGSGVVQTFSTETSAAEVLRVVRMLGAQRRAA